MQDAPLQCDYRYQMWNFETSYAYVTKSSLCAKLFSQTPLAEYKYKYKYNQSHVIVRKRRNISRLVTDRSQGTVWQWVSWKGKQKRYLNLLNTSSVKLPAVGTSCVWILVC
jgi:hypothetical protein